MSGSNIFQKIFGFLASLLRTAFLAGLGLGVFFRDTVTGRKDEPPVV